MGRQQQQYTHGVVTGAVVFRSSDRVSAIQLAVTDLMFRCGTPAGSQALKDTRRGLEASLTSFAVVAVEILLWS